MLWQFAEVICFLDPVLILNTKPIRNPAKVTLNMGRRAMKLPNLVAFILDRFLIVSCGTSRK